jgi:hypothetical protein
MHSFYSRFVFLFWIDLVCIGAFSVPRISPAMPSSVMPWEPPKMAAYFYGVDSTDDDDKTLSGGLYEDTSRATPTAENAVETMNQRTDALARIVAAFPPVGHALALSQIEHISVSTVDEQHMQVEVTLCEGESCTAVDVPVAFPHPCEDSVSFDCCVLDNFGELDQQAELLLQHAEWDAHNLQGDDLLESDTLLEFTNEDVQLPAWWVTPNTPELAAECIKLRQMFNEEEFDSEMKVLAKFGLGPASLAVVKDAVVCAVGPAGIIMEAQLLPEGTTAAIFNPHGLAEIPIAFPSVATNVHELRSNALATVDSASL